MKNTLLLFLILVLTTFSLVTMASEIRVASTGSCSSGFTLPNNQWRQISLPCVPPAGEASVDDVFGDDIAEAFGQGVPSYGSNWIVYKHTTSGYQPLSGADNLKVGAGYWLIQQSGSEATLDLPATSTPAPAVPSDACPSAQGCFEIALETRPNSTGWNMVGGPGYYASKLGDVRVYANDPDCKEGCDLDAAQSHGLVHSQFWTYNGSNYTAVSNPNGELEPWVGYWTATLLNAHDVEPRLLIPKAGGPGGSTGSQNTLPKSPDYTYRIPTTTELVAGGHNELSALNKKAWNSTGNGPVEYGHHGSGSEQYSLYISARADKSQMYQEIPTKPGRVYMVKATSFKPEVTDVNFYPGADVYFTVESNIPSAEKANVLGESSSTTEYGYTEHTFEFTATGETAYIVGRSDQENLAIHVSSVSVKEKGVEVPFKYISEIKHEGVTLPFASIKQWRSKQKETVYSEFSGEKNTSITKNIDEFVAGNFRLPTKRKLELDRTEDSNILALWGGEAKAAAYWAVRGLVEENADHFDKAVKAIDKWAQVFGGITGHGAGVYASWFVKEYANAMEILLHNDIGYEYPAEEKARAEPFMDTLYSVMLRDDGTEMFESGRFGGNWVASQIMAKLSYWIVKDSFATTDAARKTATNKFNFISRFIDSLLVSQVYLNSDPLGVPNTFYANGLDEVRGRMPVKRIHGGKVEDLNGIWYIGVESSCFQHDGLVEEYYRDIGHAHMGMEPVYNIAQILYMQGGENLFERHKERLVKASEVLQETHLAALNITNPATGTPYTYLPKPECNPDVKVRIVEYKDRNNPDYADLYQKLSKQGALYSSQLYGYAKTHWSDWQELLPKTHAVLVTESKIEPWETGVPAVYLEAMFLRE